MPEFLIVADAGGPVRHLGDEALLAVVLDELSRLEGSTFAVIAEGPTEATQLHGARVIPPVQYTAARGSAHDTEREHRLVAALAAGPGDPELAGLLEAMESASAVILCGGGNLCATWPDLLYQRVLIMELAHRAGLPVIVGGQTVGPSLTPRQHDRLAAALAPCCFVGARDSQTLARLHAMGVAAHLQTDDAAILALGHRGSSEQPYVALAVHNYTTDLGRAALDLAAVCTQLNAISGLPILLVPNTAPAGEDPLPGTDSEFAYAIALQIADERVVRVAPLTDAVSDAMYFRDAAAVVSSRFHPLVFALAAGVPSLGVVNDRYTEAKIEGALESAGLPGWQLPTSALGSGVVGEVFAELWARRTEIASHLIPFGSAWRQAHQRRWDGIREAVSGHPGLLTIPTDASTAPASVLAPRTSLAQWLTLVSSDGYTKAESLRTQFDEAEAYAFSLSWTLQERDKELAELRAAQLDVDRVHAAAAAERADLQDELDRTRDALQAANDVAIRIANKRRLRSRLADRVRSQPWSRPLRWIYRLCKRVLALAARSGSRAR